MSSALSYDKELRPLVELATSQGWSLLEQNGKLRWCPPEGGLGSVVFTPTRVGQGRALKNVVSTLSRAGVDVESLKPAAAKVVASKVVMQSVIDSVNATFGTSDTLDTMPLGQKMAVRHGLPLLEIITNAVASYTDIIISDLRELTDIAQSELDSECTDHARTKEAVLRLKDVTSQQGRTITELNEQVAALTLRADKAEKRLKTMRDALSGEGDN